MPAAAAADSGRACASQAAKAPRSARRGGHDAACRGADGAQAGGGAVLVVGGVDDQPAVGEEQAGVGLTAQAAKVAAAAVGAQQPALHVTAANVAQGEERQAVLAEGDALDQVLGAGGVGAVAAVERDQVFGLAVAADAVPGGAVPVEQLAAVLEDGGGALPAGLPGRGAWPCRGRRWRRFHRRWGGTA